MKQKKISPNKFPDHDWQILGEIELTIGVASNHTINKWLAVILSLLELHTDFAAKVLRSARIAVSRALQFENIACSEHIHLIILVPEDFKLNNQNWGFFRIEKIGNDEAMLDHTIELYIYQEG